MCVSVAGHWDDGRKPAVLYGVSEGRLFTQWISRDQDSQNFTGCIVGLLNCALESSVRFCLGLGSPQSSWLPREHCGVLKGAGEVLCESFLGAGVSREHSTCSAQDWT